MPLILKSFFIVTQIYLIFMFIFPNKYILTSAIRTTRIMLLYSYQPLLYKTYLTLLQIYCNKITRMYKIIIFMYIGTYFISAVLLSNIVFTHSTSAYKNDDDLYDTVSDSWYRLVYNCASYVYGYGISVYDGGNAGDSGLYVLALILIYVFIIVFMHGLLIYVVVCHFMHLDKIQHR